MAPLGLAHRPTDPFVAEWTDHDPEPQASAAADDELRLAVERARRDAGPTSPTDPEAPGRAAEESGWFAGEPMI